MIETIPCIWIRVEDKPGGDLVARLHKWFCDAPGRPRPIIGSYTAFAGGSKTINVYAAGFAPDAAEQVLAWLRANGADG